MVTDSEFALVTKEVSFHLDLPSISFHTSSIFRLLSIYIISRELNCFSDAALLQSYKLITTLHMKTLEKECQEKNGFLFLLIFMLNKSAINQIFPPISRNRAKIETHREMNMCICLVVPQSFFAALCHSDSVTTQILWRNNMRDKTQPFNKDLLTNYNQLTDRA